jgi:hypothetical protein
MDLSFPGAFALDQLQVIAEVIGDPFQPGQGQVALLVEKLGELTLVLTNGHADPVRLYPLPRQNVFQAIPHHGEIVAWR